MQQNLFKEKVEAFLLNDASNKELNLLFIDLDTNLWDKGLVDSFRIMELILFLEDFLGKEISVESNFISNFHTIGSMYNSLVLQEI
jgi:acyl carrier protein